VEAHLNNFKHKKVESFHKTLNCRRLSITKITSKENIVLIIILNVVISLRGVYISGGYGNTSDYGGRAITAVWSKYQMTTRRMMVV
jgi:hypothetical protein